MNDTAVITGGSRGIGLAVAKAFAEKGYRIALLYCSRTEEAEAAVEALRQGGTDAECYQCDVADGQAVEETAAQILQRFGRVDVLVNNAGIAQIKPFTDITQADWDRMFDVNVKGVYNCAKAFVAGMISRKAGRIINVSSMWGITGASCEVHYSASKAAVIGFTKALGKELAPSGITVNCIAPGVIDTDMNAGLDRATIEYLENEIPTGRMGTGAEVASAAVYLASEGASYVTGQVITIDGGLI